MDGQRKTAYNSSLAKWRVTCFYDSLVLNQSAVLRLNFCAKNPPLRQAAKRYGQVFKKVPKIILLIKNNFFYLQRNFKN